MPRSFSSMSFFFFPGGCFRCWGPASPAWTRTPCTRCCWISWPRTTTGGSTWTESGSPVASRSRRAPAASTSTRTPPTLERIGWKRPSPSAKSNSPINSTGEDRWGDSAHDWCVMIMLMWIAFILHHLVLHLPCRNMYKTGRDIHSNKSFSLKFFIYSFLN